MKRKYGVEKFPHILESIDAGKYTVREPEDRNKYSQQTTWSLFRLIFDEDEKQIEDHYFCSRCRTIYNLKLSQSGQSLKRHAEKCKVPSIITDFFVPEMQPAKRSKIIKEDKALVREAAIKFVVKDMRPVSSVNGEGMTALLSRMTYIGAKYGHISEESMLQTKLIPSRQSVRNSFRIRVCVRLFKFVFVFVSVFVLMFVQRFYLF